MSSPRRFRFACATLSLGALALLLFSACSAPKQAAAGDASGRPAAPTAAPPAGTPGPGAGEPPQAAAAPNPASAPVPTATTAASNLASGQSIDLSNPLRFDFSTYTPVPTLDWRPPSMQVPVSIRPEDHFWFARPLASDTVSWPHPFYRYGNTYFGYMSVHAGVDLDADVGTPVLAAGPGKVVWVGWGLFGIRPVENDPYGLAIAIKHDFGYNGQDLYTVYAHLSEVNVWLDEPVELGDLIGWSGNTGNSSGPHLHFEVRVGENKFRNTRNPELWLAPPQGWGVIAGRLLDEDGRYLEGHEFSIRNEFGQRFLMWAYGPHIANPDDIYQENFVLSDLPAGTYWIDAPIEGEMYRAEVEVYPGQTTFVVVQEGVMGKVGTANPHTPMAAAPTITATPTMTPTVTGTPTITRTPTATFTPTHTPTNTPIRLGRPSPTP